MNSEPLLPVKTVIVREPQLPRIALVLILVAFVLVALTNHRFVANDRLLNENDHTLAAMQNEIEEQVLQNTKAIDKLAKRLREHSERLREHDEELRKHGEQLREHEEEISIFEMMFAEPESARPHYSDVVAFTDEMILASAAAEGESPESDVTGAAADHKPTQQDAP